MIAKSVPFAKNFAVGIETTHINVEEKKQKPCEHKSKI